MSEVLKRKLIQHCKELLVQRITNLEDELMHLAEAIADDTKSSAGDKYETSREMANLEREKLATQLAASRKAKLHFDSIEHRQSSRVEAGSLVKTTNSWIFIGVSLGIIDLDSAKIMVISPAAPLAQTILGLQPGAPFEFNSTSNSIEAIY